MLKDNLDIDNCIDSLYKCELLTERQIKVLCEKVKEVLSKESNV